MDCVVCQETHKCVLKIDKCKHFFCSCCLYQWYAKKHTCPLCRTIFRLEDLNVVFRKGVKTRGALRLVEEEEFILELARLTHMMKLYHLYGRTRDCCVFIEMLVDKCLNNIHLFHNYKSSQIKVAINYLINYDFTYKKYIFSCKDKYALLMEKITGRKWYWNNDENYVVTI